MPNSSWPSTNEAQRLKQRNAVILPNDGMLQIDEIIGQGWRARQSIIHTAMRVTHWLRRVRVEWLLQISQRVAHRIIRIVR